MAGALDVDVLLGGFSGTGSLPSGCGDEDPTDEDEDIGMGDSLLVALYACITFIYGSSWKGEIASEAKRSLDKSSEMLGEPGNDFNGIPLGSWTSNYDLGQLASILLDLPWNSFEWLRLSGDQVSRDVASYGGWHGLAWSVKDGYLVCKVKEWHFYWCRSFTGFALDIGAIVGFVSEDKDGELAFEEFSEDIKEDVKYFYSAENSFCGTKSL
ncbi:hypothetical protein Tco_0647800 [Tanacetum coccineum]